MSRILPSTKMPKLIVVVAFDRGEDGGLVAAFGPADQQSEERTVRLARSLATRRQVPAGRRIAWAAGNLDGSSTISAGTRRIDDRCPSKGENNGKRSRR